MLPMVDLGVTRILIPSAGPIANHSSSRVKPRHHVVLDLEFARTIIVFRRGAENIQIEERLQVNVSVVYEMRPMCYRYLSLWHAWKRQPENYLLPQKICSR
ncbi:hypothetical protein EUGRSUZ_C02615 [Eucalyptus grandis]|uniref:Uncharacterized protein n=2 Tax=Eucalyptus grandis TaxID=71139 RepID=A0ACC3LGR2_EUCGR|nr:hypothetical protein EUGRSUZ_C02615 [Eucalyptus grandis]